VTEPEGAKIKCQKYDTCKDEFRSIGSCFMQDCFEGAVQIPAATRERYSHLKWHLDIARQTLRETAGCCNSGTVACRLHNDLKILVKKADTPLQIPQAKQEKGSC